MPPTKRKYVYCPHCGKGFTTIGALEQHIRSEHG